MKLNAILAALILSSPVALEPVTKDLSRNSELCINADTQAGTPTAVRILGMLSMSFKHYPMYKNTLISTKEAGVEVHSFCMGYGALAVLREGSVHVNIGMDEFMETSPAMTLIGSGRILREETMVSRGLVPSPKLDRRANTMITVAVHADSWSHSIAASIEMALYFKRERAFYEVNKPGVLWSGQKVTDVIGPIQNYFVEGAKELSTDRKNQIRQKIFTRFFTDIRLVNYIASLQTENASDGTAFDAKSFLTPIGDYLKDYDFDASFPLKVEQ